MATLEAFKAFFLWEVLLVPWFITSLSQDTRVSLQMWVGWLAAEGDGDEVEEEAEMQQLYLKK